MPTMEELEILINQLREERPETRSKRLQLLITPTMYEALKALADQSGTSVNEIVNVALEKYMTGK